MEKSSIFFFRTNINCVGAEISTLISISDGLGPENFCRNMEKTQLVREEKDGKVFLSRQSPHFISVIIIIKVLFPT